MTITTPLKHNSIIIYEYEKTYLLLSKVPALILYQKALKCIIDSKRLNLILNLKDFCSFFITDIIKTFNENNHDGVSIIFIQFILSRHPNLSKI